MRSQKFFEKLRTDASCLVQKYFLADLVASQYLFEILHTSLTAKTCENVVKIRCFEKTFAIECVIFFSKLRRDIRCLV